MSGHFGSRDPPSSIRELMTMTHTSSQCFLGMARTLLASREGLWSKIPLGTGYRTKECLRDHTPFRQGRTGLPLRLREDKVARLQGCKVPLFIQHIGQMDAAMYIISSHPSSLTPHPKEDIQNPLLFTSRLTSRLPISTSSRSSAHSSQRLTCRVRRTRGRSRSPLGRCCHRSVTA